MAEVPETASNAQQRPPSLIRKIWRRVENIAFSVVFALIVLYFIMQMPFVQNWLIGKVSGYLSRELQTTVKVAHVDVALFDNLVLDGFYIADKSGDTLLYANQLRAGLTGNIFSILGNSLEFDDIRLSQAGFNLRRRAGESKNNLQFILDYFAASPKKDSRQPKMVFKVKNLWLNNVQFAYDDEVRGQRLLFRLPYGNVRVNRFDLGTMQGDVQSVTLDGFALQIKDYPGKPLPENSEQPPAQPVSLADTSARKSPPLRVIVEQFNLYNGRFHLDQSANGYPVDALSKVMDFHNLLVSDITVKAEHVYFNDDLFFSGRLKHMAARERSGFDLTHVEAKDVVVSDTLAALYGVNIQTPGTSIGDTITFQYRGYRDFLRFVDRVKMDGHFAEGSHLRIGDIMYFSPALETNSFFVNNREENAKIQGRIYGKVNSLNGRELTLQLGQKTLIKGDFDGDDLGEGQDRMRLAFDFETLRSDIKTIKSIIPGFSAPAYFNKLGNISFTGQYQILFGFNHILNGSINTDVGYGSLDMELDLTGGAAKATYSGRLAMTQFDLASWTGDRNFGPTTFHIKIAEGSSGLTLPTIKAKFTGAIDTLTYKGYKYRNLQMNGAFDHYVFDGRFGIEDPNIDFSFDGRVNLQDSLPVLDISADIRRVDLGALHLVDKDWVLSGKVPSIRLKMHNLNDLAGEALLRNIRLVENKKIVHKIDIVQFKSGFSAKGDRQFLFDSDIISGLAEGKFNPLTLFDHLQFMLSRQHPAFAGKLGLLRNDTILLADEVKFSLRFKDTRKWLTLIDPSLDSLVDVSLLGRIETAKGTVSMEANAPVLGYGDLNFRNVDFAWNSDPANLSFQLSLPETSVGNRPPLEPISLIGSGKRDELKLELKTQGSDSTNIVRNLNLRGALTVVNSLWQIRFNASNLSLFNEPWYIEDDNFIRFGKKYIAAQNFELSNDHNQRILLDSLNNGSGLKLGLTNFDLKFLNKFLKQPDTTKFRGKIYDLEFEAKDVFNLRELSMYLTTDTVFIHNRPYGELTGNFDLEDLNAPLFGKLFLRGDQHQVRIAAAWLPKGNKMLKHFEEFNTLNPGEFQANVHATNFPMQILQEFIPGISKTAGQLNADVTFSGPFNKVAMNGDAHLMDGQFQIDYLKSMFYLHNQPIKLTSTQIWAEGDTIWDGSKKNMAIIHRGLRHNHFKDWQIDCSIESTNNNFMVLNTAKEDNELFYGQGIGKFKAVFSGNFSRTDMVVDVVTGKDTRLYIPLSSSSDAQDVNFITFISKNPTDTVKTKSFKRKDLIGLNLELNLTITEDAEVQLIFDEQAGDIVKGRGKGDISLIINREGEFKMFGNYVISKGEYLFTLLNVVNKPFSVASGGTINWHGDPYGAQIQLDATYEETTPVYNFISDELLLTSEKEKEMITEAKKATRAIVTMHLTGALFKPDISFELDFPLISSRLRSLTENKLRNLKVDQNEMNRQVFGLVVVGSFLPSNSGGSLLLQAQSSGINTLTQVFTSQLSNYLSGLAYEWFNGKVSSIDFDIAYNEYNATDLNDPISGRALQVRFTSGFANDRIIVEVGSQFGLDGTTVAANQGSLLAEDITVEIVITENRQWRVKAYQRLEPDFAGGARRLRFGGGLSLRKEYDSFDEMVKGLGKIFKKKG